MKIVWTIVALLLLAGIVVVFQPPTPTRRPDDSALIDSAERAMELAARASPTNTPNTPSAPNASKAPDLDAALAAKSTSTPAAASAPTTTTSGDSRSKGASAPTIDGNNGVRTENIDENAASGALTAASTPTSEGAANSETKGGSTGEPTLADESASKKPSPEPSPAKPEEIAAGSEFTPEIPKITEAEVLPSRFVKLPDGAISVDDAWTVRGAGTTESPYEVSWEYLSSAQETYVPRLSERKIPARIAFLHGKVVKISGYLAFPLVAPTSSECLAMLNQWDGCCIGIPPTPYDAIEVKLATELKGWKKHTINFGAITGVFKVEPYLVENWLVGLYLMEKSKIDTEL